jgi:hypothetical protein
MKHTVEMSSGAMIYVPSFIKIGSGIEKLIGETHRQQGDRVSQLALPFKNNKRGLKGTKNERNNE